MSIIAIKTLLNMKRNISLHLTENNTYGLTKLECIELFLFF